MPKKNLSSDEIVIDLLQKLIMIELAKEGVPQTQISRIVGVANVKVNSVLKHFNKK